MTLTLAGGAIILGVLIVVLLWAYMPQMCPRCGERRLETTSIMMNALKAVEQIRFCRECGLLQTRKRQARSHWSQWETDDLFY